MNEHRTKVSHRLNEAILRRYANLQSMSSRTPTLRPRIDRPQPPRMRCIRWLTNLLVATVTGLTTGVVAAWHERTTSGNLVPDPTQQAYVIFAALGGFLIIEIMRTLLPGEFDLGESASIGRVWRPDPDRPGQPVRPALPYRALKNGYGMTVATLAALMAWMMPDAAFAWPSVALIVIALIMEGCGGKTIDGEWRSLTDRLAGTRNCLRWPEPRRLPDPALVTLGPGGGKRGERRRRSRLRRDLAQQQRSER